MAKYQVLAEKVWVNNRLHLKGETVEANFAGPVNPATYKAIDGKAPKGKPADKPGEEKVDLGSI